MWLVRWRGRAVVCSVEINEKELVWGQMSKC